mgnify:FL=1|jgi:glutaredoxin 3
MAQPLVVMYSTSWCPYCARARQLLTRKQVDFEEIDIEAEPQRRAEMVTRSSQRTVPQIFVGEHHIGGSDDLHALESAGGLDPLLGR